MYKHTINTLLLWKIIIILVTFWRPNMAWRHFMKARSPDLVNYPLKIKEQVSTETATQCMGLCFGDCVAVAATKDGKCSILVAAPTGAAPESLDEGSTLYLVDWGQTGEDTCRARTDNEADLMSYVADKCK